MTDYSPTKFSRHIRKNSEERETIALLHSGNEYAPRLLAELLCPIKSGGDEIRLNLLYNFHLYKSG